MDIVIIIILIISSLKATMDIIIIIIIISLKAIMHIVIIIILVISSNDGCDCTLTAHEYLISPLRIYGLKVGQAFVYA